MVEHRLSEYFRSAFEESVFSAPVSCSFVPCPMFQMFHAAQQSRVQEIYRLAAEQTRVQLTTRRATRPAEFSVN